MSKETHRLAVSGSIPLPEGDGSAMFVGSSLYSAFEGLSAVARSTDKDILWQTLRIETKVDEVLEGEEVDLADVKLLADETLPKVVARYLNVEVEVMGVERA